MPITLRMLPFVAATCLFASVAAANDSVDFRATAEIRSELVQRGLAYADGDAVGLVAASVDWRSGLFAGADVFSSISDSSRTLRDGWTAYAGWFRPLGDNSALAFSVRRYGFGGTFGGHWDFDEFRADWHISRNVTLSLNRSEDYYGRRYAVWVPELGLAYDLNERVSVSGETGMAFADGEALIDEYWYARAGLSIALQRFHVAFDMIHGSDEFEFLGLSDPAGTRAVISLGISY
ncbi:MAG: hypothetical protein AAFX44_07815 [Pseudomonadota bacterium]